MANILVEKKGKIGTITVNRPEQLNSMNSATRSEMTQSFEDMETDSDVSVVILTGAPSKAFIAGADIKEFAEMDLRTREEMNEDWRVNKVISEMTKPVIAMINGFCLGGGLEIAMACDLRISSEESKLGQPEINIGIIPGAGGTQRLTRLIGEGRAMEMILTGRMITAKEAHQYGIVNFVFDSDELEIKTLEIANTIADKSPYAIERAKKCVRAVAEMSLEKGLEYEQDMFIECFRSEDGKEGIAAFIEKRKANFKGK